MAVFKAINSKANSKAALNAVIRYVTQDEKINHSDDLLGTVGFFDSDALDRRTIVSEYMDVKDIFHKHGGRYYAHYVVSYAPNEFDKATATTAHMISQEIAKETFPGYQVFLATHVDKSNHIHTHMIINSVSYLTGKKLHTRKSDLEYMKKLCNAICLKHGLSVPSAGKTHDGYVRGEMTVWNKDKYQTLLAGVSGTKSSYLINAVKAVDNALETSYDRTSFITAMQAQHYQVTWEDTKKHITLMDKHGNKVRMSNLAKTFKVPIATKGDLLDEMARRAESRNDTTAKQQNATRTHQTGNTNPPENSRDKSTVK